MRWPSSPKPRAAFPDPETLALCERHALKLRQAGGLSLRGRPRPAGEVVGLDFDRYAPYTPGADLRHLDWTVYARTRDFVLRRFADERTGLLALVVDASGSMALSEKWSLARRLAAVVGYAALKESHAVVVAALQGGRVRTLPLSGVGASLELFSLLSDLEPSGPTDLDAAIAALPLAGARGHALVVSDFLDPAGLEPGLRRLVQEGFSVDLCQLLEPAELTLPERGQILIDPEGPDHRAVPLDASTRAKVAQRVQDHLQAIAAVAARYRALHLTLAPNTPLPLALDRYFTARQR